MNEDSNDSFQELYSSASSDDQSSINSVIHVTGTSDENSHDGGESDRQSAQINNEGEELPHDLAESSSDSDEEPNLQDKRHDDSDSSSTSEDTQLWEQNSSRQPKPTIPPKPTFRQNSGKGYNNGNSGNNSKNVRHSIVSQNSGTGRVETRLLHSQEHVNAADSGFDNESPDVTRGDMQMTTYHPSTSNNSSTGAVRPTSQHSSGHSSVVAPYQPRHSIHSPHHYPQQHHQHAGVLYQSTPAASNTSSNSHIVMLPPLPMPQLISPHQQPTSPSLNLTTAALRIHSRSLLRESVYNTLSLLYAMCLVLLGTAMSLTQVWSMDIPHSAYEGFYIYLFILSILFLMYAYMCLLRSHPRTQPHKPLDTHHPLIMKSPSNGKLMDNGHLGSFYIRLGFVGFGIGSLIQEVLVFGQLFEVELTAACIDVVEAVRPVTQLIFVFMQMYFIFLNGRMNLWAYKCISCFGLMHLVATNLCVWIRTVVVETMRDVNQRSPYHRLYHPTHPGHVFFNSSMKGDSATIQLGTAPTQTPYVVDANFGENVLVSSNISLEPFIADNINGTSNHTTATECERQEIMTTVVEAASPYLYPCTVAYCLIATAILFMKWFGVSRILLVRQPSPSEDSQMSEESRKSSSVDCSGANKGLFLGIFALVAVIISMIVFFVLVDKTEFRNIAVLVVHGAEIVLYLLALIAVITAAIRVRNMRYNPVLDRTKVLEKSLLLISLTGVLALCIFNIVAGSLSIDTLGGSLLMTANALILLESVVQTVFIMCSLHYHPRTTFHINKKPGRECLTFLLVSNIAMWGINTFEVLRMSSSPVAWTFYGVLPWAVVTHITIPMAIFYRFHSSVCLATIWFNIYKKKS